MKAVLGHDGPPSGGWKENLISGEPLQLCPLRSLQLANPNVMDELESFRLEVYPGWQNGMLLRTGGLEDQPSRYLAFMREMDDVADRVELKYREILAEDEGTS